MKRNVLLITIDAFGADKCWQKCKQLVPFINNIGKRGTVFRQAVAATSSTTSSIASIHTGLYPKEHGIESTYGCSLKDSVTTLAEILNRNGFKTFATVGGPLYPETGLNKGFDRYVHRPSEFVPRFLKWGYSINRMGLNSLLLAKEAKKIVSCNNPWFYWIHFLDLHNRWRGKKWFNDRSLSDYENALLSLDKKIEQIIKKVNLKETLLVICADHGHYVANIDKKREEIAGHTEGHGFHVYDTLVHIPLMFISEELIPSEKIIYQQVSSVDILPTILDLLRIENSYQTSGVSLINLVKSHQKRNPDNSFERPAYLEACGGYFKSRGEPFLMGIRTKNWKYVISQNESSKRKPELYDLINDPDEMNNVCDKFLNEAKNMRTLLFDLVEKQKGK